MNYYYEIKLNFNDIPYSFYEWNNSDRIEVIKKIPLLKVKSNILKSIISNNFKVNIELLNMIKYKTICKGNLKIKYSCILCDTKNCIALEFDENGYSIARSNLMLEDDNNICEISYTLKETDLKIQKTNKIKLSNEFRQETKIKKIINKELIELYKNNDIKKLQYLYLEWFNKEEKNKEIMLKTMFEDLKQEIKKVHYDIYKIIKLSYNKI